MRILQVAKYYPPLNSAQALQAGKVTTALRYGNHDVDVIAGILKGVNSDRCDDVIFIEYSEKYLKGVMPSKINRAVKEILQVSIINSWVKKSIRKCEEILLAKSADIVFTQSTPFDCHLIGLYLKRKYGLKWIAAFSDPYPISIAPYPYRDANRVPALGVIQRSVLKELINSADKILVSSRESYELMCNFTHTILDNKYCIIPHIGFEGDPSYVNISGNGWLIYTGKLSKERSIRELLLAIKQSALRNTNFQGIKFIGKVNDTFKKEVHQLGLDKKVQFLSEIEQSMVKEAIKDCSGLILIEANMEYSPFLPSKFADYATLLKPILAIVPERSQVSDYIKKYGGGVVCGYDLESITNGINSILEGKIKGSVSLANNFSISKVSGIYSNVFQNVLED